MTKKLLRIMQWNAIFLLGACLTVSAGGFSQTITCQGKGEKLENVFKEIKRQTGFVFFYDQADLKSTEKVTINFENVPLREALDRILANQPLSFFIEGNTIVISKKSNELTNHSELAVFQKSINTRGRVINEKGEGVIVSVTVKGSQYGTSTDAEGYFTLENIAESATLVISGVNIESTLEINVKGRTDVGSITVTLKIVEEKDVVLNTGYWTSSKQKLLGSIVRISSKEIGRQPVTSPLLALQGRVAGLNITPINGIQGTAPKIEIRGQNSLRSYGGYPLYVIDGIPVDSRPINSASEFYQLGYDPLATIGVDNIESIEVLKDADVTAIYGSRGANGVIIITTKENTGQTGKTKVEFSTYTGIGKMTNRLSMLNTPEYLAVRREAYQNDGRTPNAFAFDINGVWDTTRYTNWQDEMLGETAHVFDAQTTILGGTRTTNFRMALGYHKESEIFPGAFGFRKLTGSLNFNHVSDNNRLTVVLNANYGYTRSNLFSSSSFLQQVLYMPPTAPSLYNANGELNWAQIDLGTPYSTWTNPLAWLRRTQIMNAGSLNSTVQINFLILPGLIAKARLGYNNTYTDENVKTPLSSLAPEQIAGSTARSAFTKNQRQGWIIEPQLEYNRAWNQLNLTGFIGGTFQKSTGGYQSIEGSNYTSDAFLNSPLAAPTRTFIADEYSEYKYTAAYGRIGMEFQSKYLVNFTARRDGSSRFGPSNRFGNFGAVGAGWIFSKEPIFHNSAFLSFGKLRASYGITGNDQVGDYMFYDNYGFTIYSYEDYAVSLTPRGLFNPNFRWERTKKSEVALELGFLNDRVNVEINRYDNRSSNQLVTYTLPATTGFSGVLQNLDATVANSGWEFQVNSKNISNKKIVWRSSANITFPKNKLLRFDGIEQSPYATLYQVGQPLTIQRLYKWEGVNPATGLHELKDVDNNGEFDDRDKFFMKPLGRKFYGGLLNTFSYKQFELAFLFQFSKSTESGYLAPELPGSRSNQQTDVLGRWQHPGQITSIGKYSQFYVNTGFYNNYVVRSDANIRNVFFARMKTVSLVYKLQKRVLNKLKISEANINVQGQNILTFTDNNFALDPETGNAMPPLKMLTVGIQLKF